MPLHLLPLSRRRFLASAAAAGVGLLAGPEAPADEPRVAADRWVLLADTHIAADRGLVHRGANMADNLARVVAEVAGLDPRPAGVVLDGDAAFQKGEPADYRLTGELLAPLVEARLPLHLTLGNHDDRDNFRAGLLHGAGRSPLMSREVAVVETARSNWFLLDTLDRVGGTPGELGKEQLDWLAGALDARPDRPALVVLHHNPQWPAPVLPTGLRDTERLFGVVVPRKQVKALIFGHTHQWGRDRHEGVHLVNLPPVAYLFTKGPPNGWVDVRLREAGATLTLHALDPKHSQDGDTAELAWR
jgi:3',5'-cyclic AMP phosphodiesterase CpdA